MSEIDTINFLRGLDGDALQRLLAAIGSDNHESEWLISRGYIETDVVGQDFNGREYLPDGRAVLAVGGKRWVLHPSVHAERVARSLDAARIAQAESKQETKSVVGTESLSQMVCPKCGDALQHTAVCPKCAAGQLGYRHRYTCVCGGVDLVSKESL